jgi:arylsulfatase A-like enzyme
LSDGRIRKRFLVVFAAGMAVWIVAALWLVPAIIRSAYAGEAVPFLNRLITGQQQTRVEGYLELWSRLAWGVTGVLVAAGFVTLICAPYLVRLPGLVRAALPGFLRRVLAGLPGGGLPGVLLGAVWIGVVAGLAEGANALVRHKIQHLPTGDVVSGEVIWMAPLAATTGFVAIGLVLALLDRASRARGAVLGVAPPLFAGLALYSFIRSLSLGFANYAAIALALGIATLTARVLAARPGATRRLLRTSTPWMAAVLLAWAVTIPVWRRARQANSFRALPPARDGAPNVILLVWDAARAPSLSLFGYDRETTPVLDRLAQRGVVFERAFATAPWSLPSHASMFTGRYPHELSVGHRRPLDDTYPTVAELLARNGYATAGFTANLFYGSASYGIARGFTWYDDRPPIKPAVIAYTWWLSRRAAMSVRLWNGNYQTMLRRPANQVNQAMLRWIAGRGPHPFFVFMNYFDAHQPYLPPQPFNLAFSSTQPRYWYDDRHHVYEPEVIRQLRDAYDSCIRYLDHQLGELVDALEKRGELDNTFIIVTSDHGEEFGEHGRDLLAHSRSLYAPVLHVPLVLYYPARLAGGVRRSQIVSIRDIPATIMDVVGLAEQSPFPGVTLARHGDGPSQRVATVEKYRLAGVWPGWPASVGDMYSVFEGDLHYILDGEGNEHLFDLAADIWEQNNLAGSAGSAPALQRMRFVLDSLVLRELDRSVAVPLRGPPATSAR